MITIKYTNCIPVEKVELYEDGELLEVIYVNDQNVRKLFGGWVALCRSKELKA